MRNEHVNSSMPKHSQCHSTILHRATTTTTKDATGNAESDTGEVENITIRDVEREMLTSSDSLALLHGVSESVVGNDCQLPSGIFTEPKNSDKFFKSLVPDQWVKPDLSCSPSVGFSNWKASENKQASHYKASIVTCEGRKETAKCRDRTELWNVQTELSSDKLTKMYGTGSTVPNNMTKAAGKHEPVGAKREESTKTMQGSQQQDARVGRNQWQWQFQASAGSLFQIRSSHLLKLTFMLLLIITVFSFVFHSRIKVLEEEKKALLGEIGTLQMNVQMLAKRMEDIVSSIPPRSQRSYLYSLEDETGSIAEEGLRSDANKKVGQISKKVVKRSATASRTTKELMYASQAQSMGINELNNETTSSYGINDWPSKTAGSLKSPKGMKDSIPSLRQKRHRRFRKQLRKLAKSHRLEIKDFKQKLTQMQQQIFAAKNLSSCNHTFPSTLSLAESAYGARNTRSVYLQIDGSSVSIRRQRQLIGPWFMPQSGDEIGFKSMWYNGLTLDSNGTSLIFQEDGLFLISAQVFYKLQQERNAKQDSMGYRIHLKKNGNGQRFQRPLTLAECVPSFPKTMLQTCFTQVTWFIEANDELYLEHCTGALPVIEALRNGQTFLSVVRL